MGKALLNTHEFWQEESPRIMWNTRSGQYDSNLEQWVTIQESLKNHLLFSTSGTTGVAKWVAISKEALLNSARAVNQHLSIQQGDSWFLALPDFHVGGFGLYARSLINEGRVVEMSGSWQVESFVKQLQQSQCQWTSLVPTQLVDIVREEVSAPLSLSGVVVGGGAIRSDILEQAISLGWPVLPSYGMSEAGSQIATATEVGGQMKLLPHMQVQLSEQGLLSWRSEAMFTGYVKGDRANHYALEYTEEWFTTKDRVFVSGTNIEFLARCDRVVKILGELVDVDGLEREINANSDQEVVLVIQADARRGTVLIPVVEDAPSDALVGLLSQFKGIEKLADVRRMKFPRNAMGKVLKFSVLVEKKS